MEQEISLLDLWRMIRKHLGVIITAVVVGVVIAVAFMYFMVTPQYTSRAQLLVNQQQVSNQQAIQLNEIQTNVQLINTYRDIIQGDAVLLEVSNRIGGQLSVGELREAISVEQSQNSQAFNISVTTTSADLAQNALNQIVNVFENTIALVYGSEDTNIFLLSQPSYNPNKVSPSLPLYILIGAFIGGALSLIYVLILEMSDNRVKDDDFLTSLGLVNLGHVNEFSSKDMKQSRISISRLDQSEEVRERI